MISHVRNILFLMFLILGLTFSPLASQSKSDMQFDGLSQNSSVVPNQELTPLEDVFSNTLDLLISRKNQTGSWALPSFSTDTDQYTGVAGGMAGIGLDILYAYSQNSSWVSETMDAKLLEVAREIGDDLISLRSVDNSTHAIWNITLSSDIVDLSYDFGLSGIATFFVELYNKTQDLTYLNVANRTLNSIYDLSNASTDFSWASQLMDTIINLNWYANVEYNAFTGLVDHPHFTGISTGIGGIAKATLAFLQKQPGAYQSNAGELLNDSIEWITDQLTTNSLEIYTDVAVELNGVLSTSLATGISGLGQLFLELYQSFNNQTYLNYATGMMHWLNGSNLEVPRYEFSFPDNATLESIVELGYQYGIAGIAEFFYKLGTETDSPILLALAKTVLQNVIIQGNVDLLSNTLSFPYRYTGSEAFPNSKTTGWARGTGGIFQLAMSIGTALNDISPGGLLDKATKMKIFLVNQQLDEEGFVSIKNGFTGLLENNPSVGIPGVFRYLELRLDGELNVIDTQIDMGEVELGKSVSKSILVENLGEKEILVTWNDVTSQGPFLTSGFSMTIGSYQNQDLYVSFIPTEEKSYSSTLTISSQGKEFEILLSGNGYDNPELIAGSSVANNSKLTSHRTIEFNVSASDSSFIDKTTSTVKINGLSNQLESSPSSNEFRFTWNTGTLANGTYTLVFEIFDVNAKSSRVTFQYEIDVYTSNLEDKIFSDTSRNILIGVVVVLVITSIFLTRRYMGKS